MLARSLARSPSPPPPPPRFRCFSCKEEAEGNLRRSLFIPVCLSFSPSSPTAACPVREATKKAHKKLQQGEGGGQEKLNLSLWKAELRSCYRGRQRGRKQQRPEGGGGKAGCVSQPVPRRPSEPTFPSLPKLTPLSSWREETGGELVASASRERRRERKPPRPGLGLAKPLLMPNSGQKWGGGGEREPK